MPHGEPMHCPKEALDEARRLLSEGRYSEATTYISENLLVKTDCTTYQPAGTLNVSFPSLNGTPTLYRRSLDLKSATYKESYTLGDTQYQTEAFLSYPDKVLVIRYTFSKLCDVDLSLKFDVGSLKLNDDEAISELFNGGEKNNFKLQTSNFKLTKDSELRTPSSELLFTSQALFLNRNGRMAKYNDKGEGGVRWCNLLRAEHDGTAEVRIDTLQIRNATTVTVYLTIATDFVDYKTMPGGIDYVKEASTILDAAQVLGYDKLLERHIEDYISLYDRCALTLPASPDDALPTDKRIPKDGKEASPSLSALVYHYGRYLLIASSRPGSQAANLQGIWNHLIQPPWASNYTLNINTEMNYWHAETANLSECAEPLFDLVRDLSEAGKAVAQNHFHCSGWCVNHNSDIWRYADTASGKPQWAFWPVAGLWLSKHLTDHYDYTCDKAFLKKYYPILRSAAEFITDFLIETKDGHLTSSPATSPENNFIEPGTGIACQAADYSVMDYSLTREHLIHTIQAAKELAIEEPLIEKWQNVLSRLRRPSIGAHGEILEYGGDFEEAHIQHRHLSHLYSAYPGDDFMSDENSDLLKAAEVSLNRRGDESTGWAMAWRVALAARFHDGVHAARVLKNFLALTDPRDVTNKGGIYANLFCAHPPFQIDGNLGICAAFAEMLLQDCKKNDCGLPVIELLPALPPTWTHGSIKGLRARHGLTVDLEWNEASINATFRTDHPFDAEIRYPDGRIEVRRM